MSRTVRLASFDIQKFIPILAILIEILWSYAWLIWISNWPASAWGSTPINLISCIVLGAGVEILTGVAYFRNWSLRRLRFIILTGSLLLLILLLRLNINDGYNLWDGGWLKFAGEHILEIITGFFFGLYLIWRGIIVDRQKLEFSELYRKFLIGIVAFIILFVIWGISGTRMADIWLTAGSYVLAYFGIGLLMLAISNLVKLRTRLHHHQEAAGSFSRRWLSMLVLLILFILGVSGIFSTLFSSGGVQRIVHFLSILGNWLMIALQYILLPIGYLLEGLIIIARWLISLLRNETKPPEFLPPDMSDFEKIASGESLLHIPEGLLLALKWGSLAIVIGLVVFFLARALVKYWKGKNEEDIEEVHETIWSWSLIKTDIRAFLSWLFRWAIRRNKKSSGAIIPPAAVMIGEEDNGRIFNIRELYQAFLWQGRQVGIPRRDSETPYEFRQKLEFHPEIPQEEVDALTEAYVTDKYGLRNPAPDKVILLNRIWRTLRSKLINNR